MKRPRRPVLDIPYWGVGKVKVKKPQGIEKELVEWANDPNSSANELEAAIAQVEPRIEAKECGHFICACQPKNPAAVALGRYAALRRQPALGKTASLAAGPRKSCRGPLLNQSASLEYFFGLVDPFTFLAHAIAQDHVL